jgi:hypothetical protein
VSILQGSLVADVATRADMDVFTASPEARYRMASDPKRIMFRMNGMPRAQDAQERLVPGLYGISCVRRPPLSRG